VIPADRRRPLLFQELPGLAKGTPWTPLAHVPTAVERCDAIGEWLVPPGRSRVFMKRDDQLSPLYGGNKVRRYEYVLADARARNARRIVTVGGLASTQAMATTLFGRALGFEVCVVLFDQPVTRFARDSVRGFLAGGAEVVYGGGYLMTGLRAWRAMHQGKDNYFIMAGAAGPLANLGYVDAMLELAGQVERGEMPRPDVIVLPTGSSGTLAALALGAAHLGWDTEIIGVRITPAIACNRLTVGAVIRSTDRYLAARDPRWKPMRGRVRYSLYGGALGRGYGYPTPEAIEGAQQNEVLTGAPGEVTYSGKALAGLRALLSEPRHRDQVFLVWNTLSQVRPVLPADGQGPSIPSSLAWMFEGEPVA
jgi:D-cysteine desulfhydrase